MSQPEEGHSQGDWDFCRSVCSWRDKFAANRLLMAAFPRVTQSWIYFEGDIVEEFFFLRESFVWKWPERMSYWPTLLSWSDGRRKKTVLLLPADIHEDKCNKVQIINLFIIQVLETNLISLEPWGRGSALLKLNCEKKGGDERSKILANICMITIKGLSSCDADLSWEKCQRLHNIKRETNC